MFYFRQQKPIPIYADALLHEEIHRTFKYIFDGNYPYGGMARLDPHLIDGPFEVDGLKVIPVPVLHGNLPILGFRFDGVAYLTDVSEIPESSFPLLEGLEVLILDALRPRPHPTHFTVEQALARDGAIKGSARFLHPHRPRTGPRGNQRPSALARAVGI